MADILLPNVTTTIRISPTYREWCAQETYDGSNYEDAKYFVEKHLTPWIESFGYSWTASDEEIAKLFSQFAYRMMDTDLQNRVTGRNFRVGLPAPDHRNLPEDRATYECLVPLHDFAEFLDTTKAEYDVLDNPFAHLLYEFCYLYVDVESGYPGKFTQKALDAENESEEEDSGKGTTNANLPDAYAGRRKNDLY